MGRGHGGREGWGWWGGYGDERLAFWVSLCTWGFLGRLGLVLVGDQ